jgi:hypothetical protein
LGHLSCRFSTRHLDICAPPAAPPSHSRPPRFHSVVGRYPFAGGSCKILVSSIYSSIEFHRDPSIPFSPKQNFHRPFIATHSFPVRPARLRRLRFAPGPGLSPGCSEPFVTASCLSPGPQFTSRHVPRENKLPTTLSLERKE